MVFGKNKRKTAKKKEEVGSMPPPPIPMQPVSDPEVNHELIKMYEQKAQEIRNQMQVQQTAQMQQPQPVQEPAEKINSFDDVLQIVADTIMSSPSQVDTWEWIKQEVITKCKR
jgi:hypothetical protein